MWLNCAFSGLALVLITKTALLLPLGQEVEVSPEQRDTVQQSKRSILTEPVHIHICWVILLTDNTVCLISYKQKQVCVAGGLVKTR